MQLSSEIIEKYEEAKQDSNFRADMVRQCIVMCHFFAEKIGDMDKYTLAAIYIGWLVGKNNK